MKPPASSAEVSPRPRHVFLRWRLTAALCSAVFPGTGQFLLHQRARAVVFWLLLLGVIILWIPLRLPHSLFGLLVALALTLLLWAATTHDALLGFRHGEQGPRLLWLAVLLPIALVVALADSMIFFHLAGFHTLKVRSSGMEPAIRAGERLVISTRDFTPEEGDIAVFHHEGVMPVKRVIGLGGNLVQGKAGTVFINDLPLTEPYVQHTGPRLPNLENFGPISVPQGQLFVLGDNRDVSLDSRMMDFGTLGIDEIAGRPLYVLTSSNPLRIGRAVR